MEEKNRRTLRRADGKDCVQQPSEIEEMERAAGPQTFEKGSRRKPMMMRNPLPS